MQFGIFLGYGIGVNTIVLPPALNYPVYSSFYMLRQESKPMHSVLLPGLDGNKMEDMPVHCGGP